MVGRRETLALLMVAVAPFMVPPVMTPVLMSVTFLTVAMILLVVAMLFSVSFSASVPDPGHTTRSDS